MRTNNQKKNGKNTRTEWKRTKDESKVKEERNLMQIMAKYKLHTLLLHFFLFINEEFVSWV